MTTLQIDILDPKAEKLLEDLAAMNLISIQSSKKKRLTSLLKKLRNPANSNITLEEITKEVELVRAKRYASRKK